MLIPVIFVLLTAVASICWVTNYEVGHSGRSCVFLVLAVILGIAFLISIMVVLDKELYSL
jgi:hypothetical protein